MCEVHTVEFTRKTERNTSFNHKTCQLKQVGIIENSNSIKIDLKKNIQQRKLPSMISYQIKYICIDVRNQRTMCTALFFSIASTETFNLSSLQLLEGIDFVV